MHLRRVAAADDIGGGGVHSVPVLQYGTEWYGMEKKRKQLCLRSGSLRRPTVGSHADPLARVRLDARAGRAVGIVLCRERRARPKAAASRRKERSKLRGASPQYFLGGYISLYEHCIFYVRYYYGIDEKN